MPQTIHPTAPLSLRLLEKKAHLTNFALSVIHHPDYALEIAALAQHFGFTTQDMVDAYVHYDLDIYAYSNEIYAPLVMRMVLHLHNLLPGSWHTERQEAIAHYLSVAAPRKVIDIGFGLPTRYLKTALQTKQFDVTLSDFEASAFTFAEPLLALWNKDWRQQVSFELGDMVLLADQIPEHDVYMFQDSIEHVPDPTACLLRYVATTPKHAKFLFSLPIGTITPIHYIEWLSTEEAIAWLRQCGLRVIDSRKIKVNPEVDLFAE
jgi:hypothetical protein